MPLFRKVANTKQCLPLRKKLLVCRCAEVVSRWARTTSTASVARTVVTASVTSRAFASRGRTPIVSMVRVVRGSETVYRPYVHRGPIDRQYGYIPLGEIILDTLRSLLFVWEQQVTVGKTG